MEWWPSATLLSPCIIDVTFFPFDYQQCSLTIGPWGYHSEQVWAWGVSKKKCNSLVTIKQWKTITFIYLHSNCCGKMGITTGTWMRICIWYKNYWRWVWQYEVEWYKFVYSSYSQSMKLGLIAEHTTDIWKSCDCDITSC